MYRATPKNFSEFLCAGKVRTVFLRFVLIFCKKLNCTAVVNFFNFFFSTQINFKVCLYVCTLWLQLELFLQIITHLMDHNCTLYVHIHLRSWWCYAPREIKKYVALIFTHFQTSCTKQYAFASATCLCEGSTKACNIIATSPG